MKMENMMVVEFEYGVRKSVCSIFYDKIKNFKKNLKKIIIYFLMKDLNIKESFMIIKILENRIWRF